MAENTRRYAGRPARTCSCAECGAKHHARGFCHKHYKRFQKYGTVGLPTLADRLWARVERGDGCWTWTGRVDQGGYGRIGGGGRELYAHRVAYELMVGPIP